jgi:hypothetical protein
MDEAAGLWKRALAVNRRQSNATAPVLTQEMRVLIQCSCDAQGGVAFCLKRVLPITWPVWRRPLKSSQPQKALQMSQRHFCHHRPAVRHGNFHIGYIMEYIQADICAVSTHAGNAVIISSADDAHGAPIMIAAERPAPAAVRGQHCRGAAPYLDGFHISFDNWL